MSSSKNCPSFFLKTSSCCQGGFPPPLNFLYTRSNINKPSHSSVFPFFILSFPFSVLTIQYLPFASSEFVSLSSVFSFLLCLPPFSTLYFTIWFCVPDETVKLPRKMDNFVTFKTLLMYLKLYDSEKNPNVIRRHINERGPT